MREGAMGDVVAIGGRAAVLAAAMEKANTPEELILQVRIARGCWPVGGSTSAGALALAAWLLNLDQPGPVLARLERTGVASPEFIERLLAGEAYPDEALADLLAELSEGSITFAKFEQRVTFDPDPEQVARVLRQRAVPPAVSAMPDGRWIAPLGETPPGPLVLCWWDGGLLNVGLPGGTWHLSRATAGALMQQLSAVLMAEPRG